ncbi:MerR family DNA-binding transcriptional regulator [Reyranella aquatilis]|uniref:MerR family DNA-binding transcriptional regulator n=1 Tax=Reyranella aquatilis TaxID=2035356 RepID=A0ABS8KWW1_9HYPH|nr:MerR family DNA-binding transcriptional regulator [Reyranella aquatilis]
MHSVVTTEACAHVLHWRTFKQTDVNFETIRYYERIKLVPAPSRTESGRRLYNDKDVLRLTFLRHARTSAFKSSSSNGYWRCKRSRKHPART